MSPVPPSSLRRPSAAHRALAAGLCMTWLWTATGCAQFDPFAPAPSWPRTSAGAEAAREYRIGVPDRLQLTVWQQPDVSGELLVRRDGKVSVPLLGDVVAEGRTPEELAEFIRQGLREYIAKPRVDVAVLEMRSQVVSVIGGGIEREGQVELERNMRLIEAIAAMGGLTPFAKRRRIRVLRNEGTRQVEYRFDYEAFLNGAAPASNLLLEPGDTIIVPD